MGTDRREIPGMPQVSSHPSRDAMGRAAAEEVAQDLRERLGRAPDARVRMVFAAAPSQGEMLAHLAAVDGVDWARVEAFHMDEYVGLADDAPQRFGTWLRAAFFDRVPLGAVHLMDPGSSDTVAEYAALLGAAPIDVVCLGIGQNGHLAFNDPDVSDLEDPEPVRVVELDVRSREQQVHDGLFAAVEDVPTHAITLTIPALLAADRLVAVVPGADKRWAVERALTAPVTASDPATALRTHPRVSLHLDPEATPA